MTGRLVILAPNWLGDAVMALPAIANLRRGLPKPRSTWRRARRSRRCLRCIRAAGVERIVVLGDRTVRRSRADRAGATTPRCCCRIRSTRRAWCARRHSRAMGVSRRLPVAAADAAGVLRRFACTRSSTTGISSRRSGLRARRAAPRLEVTPEQRAAAAALLTDAGWDQRAPLVAMAPGAAFGGAKRWPAASFAALADRLRRRRRAHGADWHRGGSSGRRRTAGRQCGAPAAIDLMGRTDLPTLAACWRSAARW